MPGVEALDVRRSLLLQAPAGSGKTTVLTARYLALLAAADAPEQILAITFTRKAAAEMRHRILAALQAPRSTAPSRASTPGCWSRPVRVIAPRGWQLRRNAARLRIETIDALSYRLASALTDCGTRWTDAKNCRHTGAALSPARRARRCAPRSDSPQPRPPFGLLLDRLDNRWLRLERLLAGMLARARTGCRGCCRRKVAGWRDGSRRAWSTVLRAQLARTAPQHFGRALREAEQLLALRGSGERPTLSAEPIESRRIGARFVS